MVKLVDELQMCNVFLKSLQIIKNISTINVEVMVKIILTRCIYNEVLCISLSLFSNILYFF